jgi:hypothetical protein
MGRGKKQYSHCVPRRWAENQYPFEGDATRGMAEHWCGETRVWDRAKPFDSPKIATCLKCAQAIGKAKLKQIANRVRLERRETPIGYDKSTYDVYLDGTHRAYIGIANGWGEKWYCARLGDPADSIHWTNGRHGGTVSGSVLDYFGHERIPADAIFWPIHFAARDAMAAAALAYWIKWGVQGFPTVEEARAAKEAKRAADALEAQAREERRKVAAQEREAAESLRLERLAIWRDALASLDGRADLTNMERAGLEAIKLLYPT